MEIDKKQVPLKEIARGEDGQLIELVDMVGVRVKLEELVEKYKGLKVTSTNYKKEAKEAEKLLRESRYTLQRINDSNKKFMNSIKRGQEEKFKELIGIVRPEEDRIKKEIKALEEEVKRKKEEEERKEAERMKRIGEELGKIELGFETLLAKGNNSEALEEYDKRLEDLRGSFESFDEFQYKAEKIQATFIARRGELVNAIYEHSKYLKEKEELERIKQEERKVKEEVCKQRLEMLKEKGVEWRGEAIMGLGLYFYPYQIEDMDELGFTRLYGKVCELKIKAEKAEKKKEEERVMKALAEEERLKRERKEQQEEAERKRQEELLMLKKGWENMLAIYKNLGGKVSEFKLKKNQVPSKSDIEQLTKATKELQKKRKEEEVVKVKEEIEPYKLSVLKFLENFEKFVQEDALSNGCVKVLGEFQSKVLEVVNEVFGKIQ